MVGTRPTYDAEVPDLSGRGSRAAAWRHIRPETTVLDVGCDTGRFGFELARHKRCTVDGLEWEPGAAANAELRLRKVYQRDLNSADAFEGLGGYDCLLFLDVLEHLIEPWAVLARSTRALRPGGILLAVLPNVSHFGVVLDLLRGRFEYTDGGTLDRTHLRWFTRRSLEEMFVTAGLQGVRVEPIGAVPRAPLGIPIPQAVSSLLARTFPDQLAGALLALGFKSPNEGP